jgi:hypothetical protein
MKSVQLRQPSGGSYSARFGRQKRGIGGVLSRAASRAAKSAKRSASESSMAQAGSIAM